MKGNILTLIKYKKTSLPLMFIIVANFGVFLLLITRFLRYFVLGMLSLGIISNVSAENNYSAKFQAPTIKKYNVSDGLSQTTVYDIAQDNNGYIWLATQAGIDRFDGYTFTHFGQSTSSNRGLSSSLVHTIEIQPNTGDLWIGTINGLDILRSSDQTFASIELRNHQGQLDKDVRTILVDQQNNVFVGTVKALYLQKSGQQGFRPISMPNQSITIHDIISQNNKRVLIATTNGILSYDKEIGLWRDALLPRVTATAIEIDSEGYLWVGTAGQGVFRAQIHGNSFSNIINISAKDGLSDNSINDIEQMSDGSIWVATANGVSIFSEPTELSFTNISSRSNSDNAILSVAVRTLLNTASGLILFGTSTEGFGVIDLNSNMFKKLDLEKGQFYHFVAKQADGSLWLSTNSGVVKLNTDYSLKGPWKHKEVNQSVNKMRSLVFDEKNKTVWVASQLGLGRISPESQFIEDVALRDTAIYSVKMGLNGNLWVGTELRGLQVLDVNTNKIIASYDIPMATYILPISTEELWAATTDGLFLINPKTHKVRQFVNEADNEDSLPHNVLTWISKRDEKSFYVGTLGHGLLLLELGDENTEAKFTRLFADEKLSNSSIAAVINDNKGNLWISTERYIFSVNLGSGLVERFDENEGVNSTGYYVGAAAVKDDGTIIFAGDEGVTYFHPDNIQKSDSMPVLEFTRVAILNSKVSHGLEAKYGMVSSLSDSLVKVVLSPKDILLKIEFAALEFGSPQSIKYAYRLIGFDERWQYLDSKNRAVTYTNLDPGSYILEVKSTNRYGSWNNKPQRMPIMVTPPWWQTTWAVITFAILALLAVFLVFRWRTIALHERSIMLYQNVQEKTRELQLANEQLTLLTTLDPLTQVYNRRGFTDVVGKEFSKYKRSKELFSIILLDIDFFKRINDEHGHEAGDQVLIKFANVLSQCTRDYDVLARWGGEEFIVLLPNTQLKDAINIANKYREIIRKEKFIVNNTSLRLSLTAGVANIQDYASVDECIKRADDLLYEGKNLGRNKVMPMF
ncbi:MAG: diguanylate cyclase (GGDEF)-like protein [Glaciecola sp.]|jgi:diguanylate cyclase (GGDEF)-like protein